MNFNTQNISDGIYSIIQQAKNYAPKVVWAIITLVIGRWIIGRISKFTNKVFAKSKIDVTVSRFLASLISVGLKVLLLISVAGMFGVQTTSFIALIGAAGLAIGMSLQGSLANFAGGVLILLFKPYQVGDLIEAQGEKGHVAEIGVFTTTITTLESNTAIVPNGPIINNNIVNYSTKESIRVDVHVDIAYDANIDTAKEILLETVKKNQYTIKDPAPAIYVNELGDSSVNLIVRGYALPEDYRDMYFALTEETKKALDKAGIEIPFPQRVIHTK